MYRVEIEIGNLYERRRQLGYSLRQLADRSGVPKSTLSRYERGETNPTPVRLVRLAKALATSPGHLGRLVHDQP